MKKIIIGNWKMSPETLAEARSLVASVERGLLQINLKRLEVVVAVPTIFLAPLRHSVHLLRLAAQNLAHQDKEPLTGGVSAKQIRKLKADYVIIGHSERRALGETDEQVQQKVQQAVAQKINPVVCVGYGVKKNSKPGTIKRVVTSQAKKAFSKVKGLSAVEPVIAFEQIWSISKGLGTGHADSPEHAMKIIHHLEEKAGKGLPKNIRVIYGGSVSAKNSDAFVEAGVDGVLPGGASLHPEEFLKVIKSFSEPDNNIKS